MFLFQVYERLNHLGVTISYCSVINLVKEISRRHTATLRRWITEGYLIKFVGDNVNWQIKVRQVRLDHKDHMQSMYIVIAIQNRVLRPADNKKTTLPDLSLDKWTIITNAVLNKPVIQSNDFILNYTKQFCHYAALATEFIDAWKEGDGDCILRCWKILLSHFRATGRTKLALEALTLQFQMKTFNADLVSMLKWGRFVNTHGGLGRNLPCDLHCEHMVRLFKETVHNRRSTTWD